MKEPSKTLIVAHTAMSTRSFDSGVSRRPRWFPLLHMIPGRPPP